MRWKRTLTVVGVHAEGEYGKGRDGRGHRRPGPDHVRQDAVARSSASDGLRKFLLYEPRGAAVHSANVILPSRNPKAALGYVDHGVDGVRAHVGLQHDLHGHGDPGDRHPPDAGAGDAAHAGGARRADRGDLPVRGRAGPPGEVPERAGASSSTSTRRSRSPGLGTVTAGRGLRRHALRARRRGAARASGSRRTRRATSAAVGEKIRAAANEQLRVGPPGRTRGSGTCTITEFMGPFAGRAAA